MCPTREDNLLLKILLQPSLKLVLVQTVKSKPSTLYSQAREWTTKSKLYQTILVFSRKKKKENPKESTKKENQVVVDNQEKFFALKAPFP